MTAGTTVRALARLPVVAWYLGPFALAYARDRRRFLIAGGRRRVSAESSGRRAARLRRALVALGPTFIKLGQLLSARPDVLPPAYVDELSELQDRVPPAPWPDAAGVIRDSLGDPESVYDSIETEAISGASLGQVYRGVADGDPVAIKVRRPGVESLVGADLRVMRWILPLLTALVDESRAFSLSNLADEFDETIREEMDYEREARMARQIAGNFADDPDIVVPAVLEAYSTERVLTMAYVPGTKITDVAALEAAGHDRSELAECLERAYLQMIADDGVFHADPHPGNLAVSEDGALVFYDFGMSGHVPPHVRDAIVDFYLAAASDDVEGILDALVDLGTLSPTADRAVMGEMMALAIADARGEAVDQYRVNRIVRRVEDTIYEFPFRLPQELALVLRVATVVEGVCVTLDPEFDFISVASTYLREQGYAEETARQVIEESGEAFVDAARSSVRVPPKLERTLDRAEQGQLRVRTELEDGNAVFDRLARRLVLGTWTATAVLGAIVLYGFGRTVAALAVGLVALALAAVTVWLLRSRRGLRARPQFTRQGLKERQGAGENGLGFAPGVDGGDEDPGPDRPDT